MKQALASIPSMLIALGAGFFAPDTLADGEYYESIAQGQIVPK